MAVTPPMDAWTRGTTVIYDYTTHGAEASLAYFRRGVTTRKDKDGWTEP